MTLPLQLLLLVTILISIIIITRRNRQQNRSFSHHDIHTPTLDTYATDFTAQAADQNTDPVIGRHEEILRLAQVLSRKSKNNAILVGPPGVGKTAIVEGLAQRIASNEVPDTLKGKRVIALEVTTLLAGTKYRGEFEQRAKKIVKEIQNSNRQIILFIDEIHTVIQTQGTEGAVNFADILKPALARGDLQLIGATTHREYEQYIQSDSSLERRFQPVDVKEPTIDQTIAILNGIKDTFRDYHKVEFTDAALELAATLTHKKIEGRKLPDKAIDAIDEAAAMVKVHHIADHIPTMLLSAAAKKDPNILDVWKHMQAADIALQKKDTKTHAKKVDELEEKLAAYGVLVVDSEDIEAVVTEWYE